MPTIPQYEANQVATDPGRPNFARNNFDASPVARSGRALSQVGGTLLDIGLQEQRKVDDTQVLSGNRLLSQFEIDTLDNPETGALSKKGKDAIGLPDTVLPAFDKKRAEIEAGMNARAKARFASIADGRRQDIERKLFDHVARQSDVLNQAETEANTAQSLNEVSVNWRNPERVAAATDLGWAGQYARLQRQGMPPEAIKVARDQWEGQVTGSVLDQMIANRDPGSRAYYEANRAKLGAKSDEYFNQIDELDLQIKTGSETARIVGQKGLGAAAYAEARKIQDPKLRDNVLNGIDREFIRADRLQALDEKAARANAFKKAATAPVGWTPETLYSPVELVELKSLGLYETLRQESNNQLKGVETRTDPRVYDTLQRLPLNELAKVDLTKHYDNLSPSDRDYFAKRQKDAQDPSKQAQFATEGQQLEIVYGDLGIPAGTKGATKRAEFDKAYREDLRVWIENNKREPTAEERQKILNGLTLPFVRKNRIFSDDKVPAYKLNPSDPKIMERITIPDDARAEIVKRRAESGKPPLTEEQLMRVYIQWKGQ